MFTDNAGVGYPRKETCFYGKNEEFYEKLVEYAELLQCRDNEEKEKGGKVNAKIN